MDSEFEALEANITQCRRCPRLVEWREHVALEKIRRFKNETYWGRPVPAFGTPEAEMIIIGLAPAAHGGNRTGRIFTGDRSGEWLYEALYEFGFANQPSSVNREDGLTLRNCLVTAVVRCAPPDNKPSPGEMNNCREYLFSELGLAKNKKVVVALGQIAFRSFIRIWLDITGVAPDRKLHFCHGGEWVLPGEVVLISSYHPSQQNTQTGKLSRPMFHSVFMRAREILSGD